MNRRSQGLLHGGFAVLLAWTFLASGVALGDAAYIREVEGLLQSLPSKDKTRLPLTMRLADAHFDESVALSNNPMPTEAETAQIKKIRRRAIYLYEESLTGLNGAFSAPSGVTKGKIQFQLARLYSDDGQIGRAENLWKMLVTQEDLTDLKRESALRLGELHENRNTDNDLRISDGYYTTALKLCSSQDVCSYVHYRLAWVAHRQNQSARAISEIKLALWDSKGQVREEALRDMVAFLSVSGGDGKVALETIEALAEKLNRPSLKMDLTEGFFAAGNKVAGTNALEWVTRQNPSLKNFVRLMEEYYGFRNGDKFDRYLDEATTFAKNDPAAKKDQDVEKVIRRLTVQLDGERVTKPEYAEKFKRTVQLYLAIFSDNGERSKMIDGWLVAEKNPEAKIAQLKKWISEEKAAGRTKEEIRLREIRASQAQKTKQEAIVVEEMTALAALEQNGTKKRPLVYQVAHSLYKQGQYDQALPLFKAIAKPTASPTAQTDKWAVQSQHLILDILGQRKQYADVVAQAETFTTHPNFNTWIQNNKDLANELRDMVKIVESAKFEWAVSMGETAEALAIFKNYCENKMVLPKSCENAQILAVKLKDQPALLSLLKTMDKKDELASEYEAAGLFAQAADLMEQKMGQSGSLKDMLKLALLYELASKNVDRNRILKAMVARFGNQKSWGPEEDLVYQTLKDAEILIDAASLKMPWSKDNRIRLIDALETAGKGTAETRKTLTASCENMGTAWAKIAMGELKALDREQAKVTFTGKKSKQKFMVRLDALKKLEKRAECYLQGADASTRVLMATLLSRANTKLAGEIKASAQQAGMDPEMAAQVQASLAEMAAPFENKAQSYADLAQEQLGKVESPAEQVVLKEKIAADGELQMDSASANLTASKLQPVDRGVTASALQALNKNPNERAPLQKLKDIYSASGHKRLAAYYQGRLIQLEQGGK